MMLPTFLSNSFVNCRFHFSDAIRLIRFSTLLVSITSDHTHTELMFYCIMHGLLHFYSTGHISERNQESCLRLLLLLLPQSHQAVLRMLIQFLRDLIRNSEVNKMSLRNVALILAPNLIPGSALRSQNKEVNVKIFSGEA